MCRARRLLASGAPWARALGVPVRRSVLPTRLCLASHLGAPSRIKPWLLLGRGPWAPWWWPLAGCHHCLGLTPEALLLTPELLEGTASEPTAQQVLISAVNYEIAGEA